LLHAENSMNTPPLGDDPPLFPIDRHARKQTWEYRGVGPTGRKLCFSGCGREIPVGRRTRCSAGCARAWEIRSDPNVIRPPVTPTSRLPPPNCGESSPRLKARTTTRNSSSNGRCANARKERSAKLRDLLGEIFHSSRDQKLADMEGPSLDPALRQAAFILVGRRIAPIGHRTLMDENRTLYGRQILAQIR